MKLSDRYAKWREYYADLEKGALEAENFDPTDERIEHINIDSKLLQYDFARLSQDIEIFKEILTHSEGFKTEHADQIIESKLVYKADIVSDAELCVSGKRIDRDTYISLYGQEPERVLDYEKNGFHFVNRLLEYNANLLLNKKEITPEVAKEHILFLRMIFLSYYSFSRLGGPSLAKEHTYPYWKAVLDTMGW